MSRSILSIILLFFVIGCSQKAQNSDLTPREREPFLQVADSDEEWIKYYPKDFPFISGGTPIQMDMSRFSEKWQTIHPVIFAYDISQEELRDIVKRALEKYEWEYHMEEESFPTQVYRFIAKKENSRVMASVMNLGGMIVLQVIDNTGY